MAQPAQILMLGFAPGSNLLQFMTLGFGADSGGSSAPVDFWTPQEAESITWTSQSSDE